MASHKSWDHGGDETKEIDRSALSTSSFNRNLEKTDIIQKTPPQELTTGIEYKSHHDLQDPGKSQNLRSSTSPPEDCAKSSNAKHSDRRRSSLSSRILNFIFYVPPWCRWDEANPP